MSARIARDLSRFIQEGNLVLYADQQELEGGRLVTHEVKLWCEAVDREHARYIVRSLNQIGIQEVLRGAKDDNC